MPPELHPGAAPADHRSDATGISWVEVAGDAARLASWLHGADVPIRVVAGAPGVLAVAIATRDGDELVIRP